VTFTFMAPLVLMMFGLLVVVLVLVLSRPFVCCSAAGAFSSSFSTFFSRGSHPSLPSVPRSGAAPLARRIWLPYAFDVLLRPLAGSRGGGGGRGIAKDGEGVSSACSSD